MDLFYLDRLYDEKLVGITDADQKKNKNNQVILYDDRGNLVLRGHATFDESSINISNEFERVTGLASDFINKYNSIRGDVIKYSASAKGGTEAMKTLIDKIFGKSDSGLAEVMTNISGWVAGQVARADDWIQKYAQMAPDSADAYMYMFKGTNFTTPTRFSKLWITSSYDEAKETIEFTFNGKRQKVANTVYNRVKRDLARLIGEFTTENDPTGFIGFTKAPNNFKATLDGLKSVDSSPAGTFTMWYGRQRYVGMIITDIDITMSRTNVKIGDSFVPLYINADFTVRPVVKYTSKNFDKWLM